MKPHWADWTYASVVALALLELAALLVFKTPHGFEEQVGWYLSNFTSTSTETNGL